MRCGDIVRNYWAGEDNPIRYFIFIRNEGEKSLVVHWDGKKLKTGRYYSSALRGVGDNAGKFVIVWHIDLKEFLTDALFSHLSVDGGKYLYSKDGG